MKSISGYAEQAATLINAYESVTFEAIYGEALVLLPQTPVQAADIGAGTGRDAAALARLGHAVIAVEPTAALREAGQALHGDAVRWLDDGLPALAALGDAPRFGLILLTAVLMHLPDDERSASLKRLSALLEPGGRLFLTLRHGPVPEGRTMFDVSADEVAQEGVRHGLVARHTSRRGDMFGREGVWWEVLVLQRA